MWSPIIFVNIDGSAPPLKEFLSPVCRQLQGYDISTLAHAGDMTWEIESNWKFIYEKLYRALPRALVSPLPGELYTGQPTLVLG